MDGYAHAQIVHYAMMQYLLRKGLKKFKAVGGTEVEKELIQLHMKSTLASMNITNTSKKEKEDALEFLMILKEN